MKGPLAIVGYMGSGKSTVGRIVAEELGWRFIDLDEAVAERAGLSIPEIFEASGEPQFRNLERRELLEALDGPRESVVACGGGVVIDPRNRARLVEVPTVFLWEDTDVLYRRTRGPGRPLRGVNFEDFSRRYAERLPYYLEVAALQIEPSSRPPRRVADEILEWIRGE
ncbi:MAG: Shikimate kinase I [uncultured Rubrobacteraceae bacterium]|uniref:Shikimate kinase n=1 Tax=uncultured Rubrobacteraceae bacterium TaxID=349277 RepID=A0A6J4QNR5_9ACTN|nr:MAG: Shikimate kinase I [uncultured Rubrobacteraceae bacterium]